MQHADDPHASVESVTVTATPTSAIMPPLLWMSVVSPFVSYPSSILAIGHPVHP